MADNTFSGFSLNGLMPGLSRGPPAVLWLAVPTTVLVSCQQTTNQMLRGQKAELVISKEKQSHYKDKNNEKNDGSCA